MQTTPTTAIVISSPSLAPENTAELTLSTTQRDLVDEESSSYFEDLLKLEGKGFWGRLERLPMGLKVLFSLTCALVALVVIATLYIVQSVIVKLDYTELVRITRVSSDTDSVLYACHVEQSTVASHLFANASVNLIAMQANTDEAWKLLEFGGNLDLSNAAAKDLFAQAKSAFASFQQIRANGPTENYVLQAQQVAHTVTRYMSYVLAKSSFAYASKEQMLKYDATKVWMDKSMKQRFFGGLIVKNGTSSKEHVNGFLQSTLSVHDFQTLFAEERTSDLQLFSTYLATTNATYATVINAIYKRVVFGEAMNISLAVWEQTSAMYIAQAIALSKFFGVKVVEAIAKENSVSTYPGLFSSVLLLMFCFPLSCFTAICFSQTIIGPWKRLNVLQENTISKFVPRDFMRLIKCSRITEITIGKNEPYDSLTVLSCDIQNFAKVAFPLDANQKFTLLSLFYNVVGPLIREHHGYIELYQGSGFVAVFKSSLHATRAALEMDKAVRVFNSKHTEYPALRLASGIHTANGIVGVIGEDRRLQTCIMSHAVTVASFLKQITAKYRVRILVSAAALSDKKSTYRYMGRANLSEINQSLDMYELFDASDTKKALNKDMFTLAMKKRVEHDFAEAFKLFGQIMQDNPQDSAAELQFQLCKLYGEETDYSNITLNTVLHDSTLRNALEKFSLQDYSAENIAAWNAVEEYVAAAPNHRPVLASKFYNTYLDVNAPTPINVNEPVVKPIRDLVQHTEKQEFGDQIFDKLKNELEMVMMDVFKRFKHSDMFKNAVQARKMIVDTEVVV